MRPGGLRDLKGGSCALRDLTRGLIRSSAALRTSNGGFSCHHTRRSERRCACVLLWVFRWSSGPLRDRENQARWTSRGTADFKWRFSLPSRAEIKVELGLLCALSVLSGAWVCVGFRGSLWSWTSSARLGFSSLLSANGGFSCPLERRSTGAWLVRGAGAPFRRSSEIPKSQLDLAFGFSLEFFDVRVAIPQI